MLKIAVVDDEPLALEVLKGYLERVDNVQSVTLFGRPYDALTYLTTHKIDLLFLDIEMPAMNGIEFLRQLPDPPLTIFTTAYRNYAFDGFELGVIDFLLKPISFQRFIAAVDKVRDFLSLKTQNNQLEQGETAPESIFVKSGVKRVKLLFNEVMFIQGLKDYAIIHTLKEKIVVKGSVKMVQEMFPPLLFVRVHKSFLVFIKAITRIERRRIIINSNQIPIGRNYRGEIEKIIRLR